MQGDITSSRAQFDFTPCFYIFVETCVAVNGFLRQLDVPPSLHHDSFWCKLDLTRIKGHLLIYICIYGCFTVTELRHTWTWCRQREWAKNLFHTAPVRFCGVNTEWMCNKSFFYILQLERYPHVSFGLCLAAYLIINRFELSCFLRFVLRSDEHTRPWTS